MVLKNALARIPMLLVSRSETCSSGVACDWRPSLVAAQATQASEQYDYLFNIIYHQQMSL
jgi:hypothetical protein